MVRKRFRKRATRRKHPKFWGLFARPTKGWNFGLGASLLAVMIVAYIVFSILRHMDNPDDKLLPTLMQMAAAIGEFTFNQEEGLGGPVFNWLWRPEWVPGLRNLVAGFLYSDFVTDTASSLLRIMAGLALSTFFGLMVGLNMGLFMGFQALVRPTMVFALNIPPLAILPILLIIFKVGELSKVMLIFIGTFPAITMSVFLAVKAIPWETIIKALTLGASQMGVAYRVVLPMIMPNLLNTVAISLGAAWLFLISAEAIAATMGLGYRIFLVRRYLSMDIIIPYVLWITLLAYLIIRCINWYIAKHYIWFNAQGGGERR